MFVRYWLPVFLLLIGFAAHADLLSEAVKTARAGEVIALPAGTFAGGVTLPAGVSLRGVGYGQTIIDASKAQHGVMINNGTGYVSDLTVRDARVSGISVLGSKNFIVSRVRVTGNIVGVKIDSSSNTRILNVISDHNNYGIVVANGSDNVVANCTVADCPEIGISLPSGTGSTVFNNIVTGSATAVNIGNSQQVELDYNLYFGSFSGAMFEQIPRRTLFAWSSLSGKDVHSLQMAVKFRDAANGDYTPVNLLPWALNRVVTTNWGTEKLGKALAPVSDINSAPHVGLPDLGAVETSVIAPRDANGSFTVRSNEGIKSAGIFTKDGTLVAYLFHNLPLTAGKYDFWLPTRDYTGKPISAGEYEVRVTESNLSFQYLDHIGDNGGDQGASFSASVQPGSIAFDARGGLVMGQGWSEDHTNVRCYDVQSGALRWKLRGASDMRGVTVANEGTVYVLRADASYSAAGSRLTRVEGDTGAIRAWKGDEIIHAMLATGANTNKLVELYGKLYTIDPANNGIAVIETLTGKLTSIPLEGVSLLAADSRTGILWMVRNGVLTALNTQLQVVARYPNLLDKPAALAARNGTLAIASRVSGKIHLYNAKNPEILFPLRTIGRGDGPYGTYRTDRFLWQDAPGWENSICSLALGPNGEIAVVDYGRLIVLDAEGKELWYTFGVFGNQSQLSPGTNYRRLWDTYGDRSFALNEGKGTWTPEAFWDNSLVSEARQDWSTQFLGDFKDKGKSFGVFVKAYNKQPHLTIVRYKDYRAIPVLLLDRDEETKSLFFRKDSNRDGVIDDKDAKEPLLDAMGKAVTESTPFLRFNYLMPNGDIQSPFHQGLTYLWKRDGLDKDGVPVYRWADRSAVVGNIEASFLNPYDQKTGGIGQVTKIVAQPDGGWTMQAMLRGSGGAGLNNGAGTDLLGFTAEGRLRWVNQLADYKGIAGLGSANGVTVTSIFYAGEYPTFDADGLGLGGFTEAKELNYTGYWIDHPNMNMYRGRDGHGYVTIGDNYNGRHLWYRMLGDDKIVRTRSTFQLSEATAQTLAALPEATSGENERPQQPRVRVAHLAKALEIDGKLEKWRNTNVTPQIIIGPNSTMNGPGDCSAIIRLAYEEQNFYVQVIQFDDVPTFHQGVKASHQQDTVEMCLNGSYPNGFQFCTLKIPDGSDVIIRRRFFSEIKESLLDPEHCPRIVKVLPNAQQVTERSLLESIYGVDLAQSKVIITECKLPIDAETYAQAEKDIFPLAPGKTFWLGFMIDDNDDPGTDFQDFIGWPSTFGSFNPKEEGALAVCD